MHSPRKPFLLISFLLLFVSCYDDLDDVIRPTSQLEIKDFIWRGMNQYYLYKADVPDLGDQRFQSKEDYQDFLKDFPTPEDLFYNGLVAEQDRFSFLVKDYVELEKALDGIRVSNGMQFGLKAYSNTSSDILGYVRYVLPNSSAEAKGVQRGDIFNTVDGIQLTRDNYSQLLEPSSYTIGLARFEGEDIVSTGQTVLLEKDEYTINPVHISKVIDTEAGKIGYLMYNGFTSTFDQVLNSSFSTFKTEGISDLVLDLRYNGGGSVESASDLASMITGQFTGEPFFSKQWNADYQAYYEQNNPESLIDRFDSSIRTGERINSLQLNRLYVLTTLRTASASELLINGLHPYIQVIQIGDRTTGKFQASTTLYDSEDFRRSGAALGHKYAIQPLIYKTLNANGVTDYFEGLPPDIPIQEDIKNLGVLGDPSEPLLRSALNDIMGIPQDLTTGSDVFTEDLQGPQPGEILFQKMFTRTNFLPHPRELKN